jgi:wyosine [tRNA(Phe)-imidazoG37] synthetase (radical SAM superfamily)
LKSRTHARVFGPVPSRRLGFSLGVDVVPFKTCALDCVYCQLGASSRTTVARRGYVPVAPVVAQIREALARKGRIDYITFSGSGEPTLNANLGKMIRALKRITDVPVAVLTGSSLLDRPAVRKELSAADLVVPSLDAGTEKIFWRVNRPHPSLTLEKIADGIEALARAMPGRVWLEVMLVRGFNDSAGELDALARRIRRILPDRVQLSTVARPPAEKEARPLSEPEMKRSAAFLRRELPGIRVEVVGDFRKKRNRGGGLEPAAAVIDYLRRRPATAGDLVRSLGLTAATVRRTLAGLIAARKVGKAEHGGETFYRIS